MVIFFTGPKILLNIGWWRNRTVALAAVNIAGTKTSIFLFTQSDGFSTYARTDLWLDIIFFFFFLSKLRGCWRRYWIGKHVIKTCYEFHNRRPRQNSAMADVTNSLSVEIFPTDSTIRVCVCVYCTRLFRFSPRARQPRMVPSYRTRKCVCLKCFDADDSLRTDAKYGASTIEWKISEFNEFRTSEKNPAEK